MTPPQIAIKESLLAEGTKRLEQLKLSADFSSPLS